VGHVIRLIGLSFKQPEKSDFSKKSDFFRIKMRATMLDIILNISQGINTAINAYRYASVIFKGDPKKQYLKQMTEELGGIRHQLERLSDHIIYAPNLQVVQDTTQTRQRYVDNLREVRECLEPVQRVLGDDILSSAMILTPDKMHNAMAKNPWEVLTDIRPINLATSISPADKVPVLFNHNSVLYLGWQLPGTLPIAYDYQFEQLRGVSSSPLVSKTRPRAAEPQHEQVFEFEAVTVDERGEISQRQRGRATQRIEWINGVAFQIVLVPGGTFLMGAPETEPGQSGNEGPQHLVTIAPFYMSKYPITQKQWEAVMGSNPSYFKGENRPVECVRWHDAVEFCAKLFEKTGRIYRLPSESEWEYACRAGTMTPFYFGQTIISALANYNGNYTYASAPKGICREQTIDVGSFPPNAFGLSDMHGNVWEWCADPWHSHYQGAPSDGRVWEEGGKASHRLLRGGSWDNLPMFCRSAYRLRNPSDCRFNIVGFRVVVDL
jgi:formylglycine-generating enzyme required for sulfatase activity